MIEESKKQELLAESEVNSYFIINECGAFIFKMGHAMGKDRVNPKDRPAIQKDMRNVQEIQQFIVDNLDRFGVEPASYKDKENGDYWKWYHFWDDWKKSLSDDDWSVISTKIANGESIDIYLPTKKWNE